MQPMSGRWVCRRCYESNDAGAAACARCGLERGADPGQRDSALPAAADGAAATPPWTKPAPKSRPTWLSLAMRFALVGVIIILAIAGVLFNAKRDDNGQISGGGNLQVEDLRIGDCFTLKDTAASEVSEVDAKPCTEAHQYEMFHKATMPESDYPTEDQFSSFLADECIPAFNSYVGAPYDSSTLDIFSFTPTESLWKDGNRNVQCAVFDPSSKLVSGSLESAGR
jgi:hypothetical protein